MMHQIEKLDDSNFHSFRIAIDSQGAESTADILQYLIYEAFPPLGSLLEREQPFFKLDVVIDIGTHQLHESSLWEDMAQTSPLVFLELLQTYLKKIAEVVPTKGTVSDVRGNKSYGHNYGATAVRRALQLVDDEIVEPANVFPLLWQYLNHVCDLGHETIEDSMIKRMLVLLRKRGRGQQTISDWISLGAFRLLKGQEFADTQDPEFLSSLVRPVPSDSFSPLRTLMDHLVTEYRPYGIEQIGETMRILLLCCYGSNEKPIAEVVDWIERQWSIKLDCSWSSEKDKARVQMADHVLSKNIGENRKYYTGFHRIDMADQEWHWTA